ncbi:hypothetical protein GOP47_0010985 [Adiantum capillus-veneris]|uniref:Pentatricopeptide repeat-containing protein n=1 Tax=Adiantum capillus-veneris TaxID=13818 RepID=A0A9D4ZGX2_ADICA|nr:hypothetical protein GOP47_0010985 [Adiantum capillus-veneris]
MLEESIIVGKEPLPWHPNVQSNPTSQEFAAHISTLHAHGVRIPCGFQEELKLQPTGKLGRHVVPDMEKDTIPHFGLQKTETANPTENSMTRKQEPAVNTATAAALVTTLKICAKEKDLRQGRIIHNELIRRGLLKNNVFLGSTLVNMYAKCGALDIAQQVFDELSERNEVTWNALIAGYVQHGCGEEALKCFEKMQRTGFSPTVVTYISTLKACASIGALEKGEDIHAQLLTEHLLEAHVELANVLVDMYAKCGELDKAKEVLDELPVKNVVSWTALIAGYVQHGYCRKALHSFEQMQLCGFFPDVVTASCILQACAGVGAFNKGQEIHAWILREGLLGQDMTIANTLVDMYARCGTLRIAQQVFDELPVHDIISWNTLIDGYAHQGLRREALACIERMRCGGFSPNEPTFACIFKACADAKDLDTGQELYSYVITESFGSTDAALGNAIVDMYAKCGALEEAQDVFDQLPTLDIVAWNTLIAGYDQHNHCEKALRCFKQMQLENFFPDVFTFTCIFRVCGSLGAICKGQELFSEIVKHGSHERVMVVVNALIGMYANCGMLMEARYLFDELPVQDVVSWSALLGGFTQLGNDDSAFKLFDIMLGKGLKPNSVTFLILLNACSHGGLVDKGQSFFRLLSRSFDIAPDIEHYACIVDLYCRAGIMDEAVALIKEMQRSADGAIWRTLLPACQEWGNRDLGMWAFEGAVHQNDKDAGAFVCISNVFSAASRQEHASSIFD